MGSQRGYGEKKQEMVAVAIDKDKASQAALKWAVDNLLGKGKSVTLIHIKLKSSFPLGSQMGFSDNDKSKELFLPFRCFCTRKDIQVTEVVVEDTDVAKALCEYVKNNSIEVLVVGSAPKNGFVRFKTVDIPGNVTKMAPEFCNVYVISKGKVVSSRNNQLSEARSLQVSGSLSHDPRFGQSNGARGIYVFPTFRFPFLVSQGNDSELLNHSENFHWATVTYHLWAQPDQAWRQHSTRNPFSPPVYPAARI